MVDDLPKKSSVNADLAFFERHFHGVMPLEFEVDTHKKQGLLKLKNLEKIDQFEKFLRTQPELSPPVSLVTFLKASTQAFYNGDPRFFRLPDNSEKNFILSALANSKGAAGGAGMNSRMLRSFADSTGQKARISLKIADIGSQNLDTLMNKRILPAMHRIFNGTGMDIRPTGTTIIFTKGNEYIIHTLRDSLLLAFGLVGLVVLLLFRSFKTVFFALIPNAVTLLLTAGIMGYFNIALKPSTALIFVIALGIDGDNSIHPAGQVPPGDGPERRPRARSRVRHAERGRHEHDLHQHRGCLWASASSPSVSLAAPRRWACSCRRRCSSPTSRT